MSMFTLAISCLTTSSLPWFMDFTCQVPVQYCSLQHPTLLPSAVTFTTVHCFCMAQPLCSFWSYFSSLFQRHIGQLLTWGVHLSVSYLFAFSYCSWGSQGKNTEVACPSSKIRSSGCAFLEQPSRDTPRQGKRNPSKMVGVARELEGRHTETILTEN